MNSLNPFNRRDCESLVNEFKLNNITSENSDKLSRIMEIAVLSVLYAKGFTIKDIPSTRRKNEPKGEFIVIKNNNEYEIEVKYRKEAEPNFKRDYSVKIKRMVRGATKKGAVTTSFIFIPERENEPGFYIKEIRFTRTWLEAYRSLMEEQRSLIVFPIIYSKKYINNYDEFHKELINVIEKSIDDTARHRNEKEKLKDFQEPRIGTILPSGFYYIQEKFEMGK